MRSQRRQILIMIAVTSFQTAQHPCIAQGYGYSSYQGCFGTNSRASSFNGGFHNLYSQNQPIPRSSFANGNTAQSTMASLEQMLNVVDNNTNWRQAPGPAAQQTPPAYQAPPRQYQAPSGPIMKSWQGMFPGTSKQELMRVFLEGGAPQSGGGNYVNQPDPSKTSNAYANYQTACNEARKSRNEANTARHDRDRWNRKNAATRAEYAARNAEFAAQRAQSAACSGDAQARSYANLARQEANRARYNANQARYNADTIQ